MGSVVLEKFLVSYCVICAFCFFTLLVWLIFYGLWLCVFMGFLGVQKCASLNLYVVFVLFLYLFSLFFPILLCSFLLYLTLLLLDTCLFSNGSENGRLGIWVLGGSGGSWERRIVIRICLA